MEANSSTHKPSRVPHFISRVKSVKLNKEFLVKNYHWFVLLAIFLFAMWIRSFSLNSPYVNADDPYLDLRLVEYMVNEKFEIPKNDTLMKYPIGVDQTQGHVLWQYIPATIGILFKVLGFSNPALLAVHFYPVLFGGLTVLAGYFLVREISPNRRELALLASFFLAVASPIIIRTTPPSAIKEPLAGFFLLVSMLFFVRSVKQFNIKDALLAGLFLVIMNLSWGGYVALVITYAAFGIAMLMANRFDKNFTHTFLISFLFYFIVGNIYTLIVGGGPFPTITALQVLASLFVVAVIGLKMLDEKLNFLPASSKKYFGTYACILSIVAIFGASAVYEPLGDKMQYYFERIQAPLSQAGVDVVSTTVAYYRPSNLNEVLGELSIGYARAVLPIPPELLLTVGAFTLSLLGFAAIAWKFYKRTFAFRLALFLSVWYILAFMLGIGAVRLIFFTAFPVAVMSAYGAYYLLKTLYERLVPALQKYQFSDPHVNAHRISLGIVGVVLLLIAVPHAVSGYGIGRNIGPSMSSNWEEALVWLNQNSEPNDVVLSWWDYGYIIMYYAKRATYVDPGHSGGSGRDVEVANFFMSTSETEYLDWLKSLNIKYVIHDASMVGKYGAVSTIGSNAKWVDQFLVFGFQDAVCVEQSGGACTKQITKYQGGGNGLWLVQTPQVSYPVFIAGNRPLNVSSICAPNGTKVVTDPNGIAGCAIFGQDSAAYLGVRCDSQGCLPHDLSDTVFARMWFRDAAGMQHFEKVHDNGEVKIFKVK